MDTLYAVFEHHCRDVKWDVSICKRLYRYQVGYVNANKEHMEFFGGALLGVQVVRFKDSDVLRFYEDILDIDFDALQKDIRKLTTINHDFKVAGDVFNLTCIYVLHKLINTKQVPEKDRARALYDTALIFFYRCIAALLSAYFHYPADPKIAQVAYGNLSNKFLIKKLGSWHKVMDYRAKDMVDPKGLHWRALSLFNDDSVTMYVIADMQGRIRDLVKNYYAEFKKVHDSGDSIAVTKSTWLDADGEDTLKEKTTGAQVYVAYLQHSVIDTHSFVREDMISVVVSINVNTSARMVRSMLLWMCQMYNDAKWHKKIDDFLAKVMVQSLYFIDHQIAPKHQRDYPYILTQLKNLYLSTRTTDEDVDAIRELGYELIRGYDKTISEGLVLSTRTSLLLYVTLRGLVGKNAV